jgi:hypothetical protein
LPLRPLDLEHPHERRFVLLLENDDSFRLERRLDGGGASRDDSQMRRLVAALAVGIALAGASGPRVRARVVGSLAAGRRWDA